MTMKNKMVENFVLRDVRISPGLNSRAELVTLAPGLRSERRFVPLTRGLFIVSLGFSSKTGLTLMSKSNYVYVVYIENNSFHMLS